MNDVRRVSAAFLLAVLVFLAHPGIAHAETLSLDAARSLALANSGELSSMLLAAESSVLDARLQSYESLPSLSLSSSASMTIAHGTDSAGDALAAGVSLSASQTLWSGGRNRFKAAISSLATDAAREAARAQYFSVLDEIDTAWYSLLKAYAAFDAARSSLDGRELGLSIAEIRFEAGVISIADYLAAQSECEAAKTSLSQARRDVSLSMMKVVMLTGLSEAPDIERTDFRVHEGLINRIALFTEAEVDAFAANVRERAQVSNPVLNRAALAKSKAEREQGLSGREYLPSLSAGLSTGLDYARDQGISDPSFKVFLSGTIPIEFWKTGTVVDKSSLALKIANHDLEKARTTLEIDLQTVVHNCVAQARSVVSSGKALEYARRHHENKLELYRLQAASVSDLSEAATLVSSNESQLIAAQYGFLSCLSDIRSLCAFESDSQVSGLIP